MIPVSYTHLKVRIPDTIGKTPITKDDKRVLYSGIPLRKEIELANGRKSVSYTHLTDTAERIP